MKFNTAILFLSSFILLAAGCSKKADNQAPKITLNSPTEWQSYAIGSTLTIEGVATDDNALHEAAIILTNHVGDTIIGDLPTVHSAKSFNISYTTVLADSGQHHLQVIFTDHDNAETTKSLMFNVN
ncbi:MAG: hypothetical protein JST49_15615 [Bacteroidetes bacterium]|nr:hypothetical protein [Bacteroidota bacterium]